MSGFLPAPAVYDMPAGIAPLPLWAQAVHDHTNALYTAWHDAFQTWTPTYNNITPGNGTVVATYFRADGIVLFNYKLTLGSTSSVGSNAALTAIETALGVAGAPTWPYSPQLAAYYDSSGTKWYHGVCRFNGSDCDLGYDGSPLTATVPFTWATGDILSVSGQIPAVSSGATDLR